MGFLIGEIIAFLAGAALIGLVIGWALFGGKKKAGPPVVVQGVAPELLQRAEGRAKELEADREGLSRRLTDRDGEIAQLRHQIAQNEQHRVESAGRLEQYKSQVDALQGDLRSAVASVAASGADAGLVRALETRIAAKDVELGELRQRIAALAAAGGSASESATVAELRAQVAELRAILETGGSMGGGEESEQVARLLDQVAKLSEENLGLKAAYEAAERSLEEQDGAMDQLSQVLLKAQQETATLKQEVAALRAHSGRHATEISLTYPRPLSPLTNSTVGPLPTMPVMSNSTVGPLPGSVVSVAVGEGPARPATSFDYPGESLPVLPTVAPPRAVEATVEDEARPATATLFDRSAAVAPVIPVPPAAVAPVVPAPAAVAAPVLPAPPAAVAPVAPAPAVVAAPVIPVPPAAVAPVLPAPPAAVAPVIPAPPVTAAPPLPPPLPAMDESEPVEDEDTELEALPPVPPPASAPPAPSAAAGPDDLKRIKGIGPATEKRLVGLGLTTFAQIAALDDAGVKGLAEELKISPEKIRKEGWVESARALASQA